MVDVGDGLGVGVGAGPGAGAGEGEGEVPGSGVVVGDGLGVLAGAGAGEGAGEGKRAGAGGGLVVSTLKVTELLASVPSRLLLPAASENFELATEITPFVVLSAVGVKVVV